jgi:hypothetical protein
MAMTEFSSERRILMPLPPTTRIEAEQILELYAVSNPDKLISVKLTLG